MRPCRGKRREKRTKRRGGRRENGETRRERSGGRETRTKQRALKEETIFASREIKMSDTMKRGVFFNFAALMQPRLRFAPSFLSSFFLFSLLFTLSRFSTGPPLLEQRLLFRVFIPFHRLHAAYARRIHLHKIPAANSRCSRKRINFFPTEWREISRRVLALVRRIERYSNCFWQSGATNRIGDE